MFGSWSVLGLFLECFGDSGPSKMSVSFKRGAILQKITFFRSDAVLDWFFNDFGWFWEPFLGSFWVQNRIQKSIKKSIRFWIDFWRILAPNVAPFWPNFGSKNRSKIRVEIWRKRSYGRRMFEAWMMRVRRPGRGSGRTHLSQNLDRQRHIKV